MYKYIHTTTTQQEELNGREMHCGWHELKNLLRKRPNSYWPLNATTNVLLFSLETCNFVPKQVFSGR